MVLVLLAVALVVYVSSDDSPRDHNVLDKAVVFVSAPIQWAFTRVVDGAGSLWHGYVALVGVQEENDRLREENAALEQQLWSREEQRLENERLRLLVGLKEHAPEVTMAYAQVIASSPTPLFRSLRVDVGAKDGVRVGAAVLAREGVVGRVAAVTAAFADVMLLVDANSSTDVFVQRTRDRARVRGTGSDVHLGIQVEYLARSADVEPGDVLITSGTGSIFPKGLKVGTIMAVERGAFGLYQQASAEPAVDFNRLESLMVVTGGWDERTTFEERVEPADNLAPGANPAQSPLVAPPSASPGAPP